jgi:hypothetical protein
MPTGYRRATTTAAAVRGRDARGDVLGMDGESDNGYTHHSRPRQQANHEHP